MEHIYTITTISISGEKISDDRCVGFYFDPKVAIEAVEANACDICEMGSYPYCVIEEIGAGLYYYPRKETWFKWDDDKDGYVLLEEKPRIFKDISGFGIG